MWFSGFSPDDDGGKIDVAEGVRDRCWLNPEISVCGCEYVKWFNGLWHSFEGKFDLVRCLFYCCCCFSECGMCVISAARFGII